MSMSTDVVVPCRADRACTRLDDVMGGMLAGRREHGRTSIATLRCAPHGLLDRLCPTFDADVAVTAIDATSCLLTVAGTYDPPFGRLGAVLDRTVMHGLATATTADFADRLRRVLTIDAEEGPP